MLVLYTDALSREDVFRSARVLPAAISRIVAPEANDDVAILTVRVAAEPAPVNV